MSWVIYNSAGVPLVSSKNHDHTVADGSGPTTNDEHDGFSEYDEIGAPAAPAANKLRVYVKDVSGVTALAFRDSAGAETLLATPKCRIRQTVQHNMGNGVWAVFITNVTDWNVGGFVVTHAVGKIQIPIAGYYHVTAGGTFVANAAGARFLAISKNVFATDMRSVGELTPNAANACWLSVDGYYAFAAADTVQIAGYQNCGVPLSTYVGSEARPSLDVVYVGPL